MSVSSGKEETTTDQIDCDSGGFPLDFTPLSLKVLIPQLCWAGKKTKAQRGLSPA